MNYSTVTIDKIDLQNDQFQISYMADHEHLTESIRKIGVIHPAILRSIESNDQYQVVSGFQRVRSCIHLNLKQISSIIYEQRELSDRKALLLSLHQTTTSRVLNLIEKSLALRKLDEIGRMKEVELIHDIMPLLDLEPNDKIFNDVIRLWNLPDEVKTYIVQHEVALGNALLFLEFCKEDQKNLLKLISPLKLGTNRMKEFLITIDEILRRDEIQVSGIIDTEMKATLADQNISIPQKTERIRMRLKKKRFPKMVTLETKIQKNLKQLKLPPELSLTLPPCLEGDTLKVAFSFKNEEGLKKIINKLSDISDQKELKSLLKML